MNVLAEVYKMHDVHLLKITPHNKCKAQGSTYALIAITEISPKPEIKTPKNNEQGHRGYIYIYKIIKINHVLFKQ